MSPHTVILLAIAIPSAGLVLFALVLFALGRRTRKLRREGRISYPAKTSPDSNANSSNSAFGT
jgi:hypothetical protein